MISVLFRSPSIVYFKDTIIFSLKNSNYKEENAFQKICAWEHSKKNSSLAELQNVHLSFNDKSISKSFEFVHNI